MYILDLETTRTEVKITEHHIVALLKGHLCISFLFDLPESLKLWTKYLFELLVSCHFPPPAALLLLIL